MMIEKDGLNVEADGVPTDAWNLDLPQMPVGVHGCFAVSDGKWICVVGGTSETGHTDVVQRFDIRNGSWQTASVLAWQGRLMVGGLLDAGLVVVFGGAFCVYHPDTGSVDGPIPLQTLRPYRNAGKGVVFEDCLIVVGGTWEGVDAGCFSNQAVELNPVDGTERPLSPMRIGRALFEAVAYGGAIYVFGGKVDDSGERLTRSVTDTIERYDVKSDTWTLLDVRMPLPRMVSAAVRIDRWALLFDGQPRNDALQMSSVWVFDLEREVFVQNTWISPYAAWSGGAVLVGDTVYLAGGNQLVYRKDRPGTFTMQHTIVNRFISFHPSLPPGMDAGEDVPRRVY